MCTYLVFYAPKRHDGSEYAPLARQNLGKGSDTEMQIRIQVQIQMETTRSMHLEIPPLTRPMCAMLHPGGTASLVLMGIITN